MSLVAKAHLRQLGGHGLSLAGLVAFALCVGEPAGWFGLGAVVASLWIQ